MSTLEVKLNPRIVDIVYGKKELKTLTLYPFSVGDQFSVTNIITEVVQNVVEFQNANSLNDLAFMTTIIKAIEANIEKVISIAASITEEEAKNMVDDMDNIQFVDIIDIIWSINYEPALKKGKSLLERAKSMFNSRKSLPSSSDTTLNTDSKISIESDIKTEE